MSADITTDTRRDLACDTNAHQSTSAHQQTSTTRLESREIAAEDADVFTVVQYNRVSTQMGQADTPINPGRPIDLNIDTTMKIHKSGTIPNIHLHQDKTRNDVLTASKTHPINACVTNEAVNQTAATPPFSSPKGKKRLSLKGISVANSSSLVPPELSPPLSPPPENIQPPSSFPATLTPPSSPGDTCLTPEKFSPSIVISTPTSITPILLEPSRPIPPTAITSPPALSRIGTPQRPYYSTVRAHQRNNAKISPSHLSTPSSPVDGDPRLTHLDRTGVSVLEGEQAYQPGLAALPSVSAPSHTFPSIPVQMYLQSSSPPRHILSALDPGSDDDDDDEEFEYIRSRTISARLGRVLRNRRSGDLGRKRSSPWSFLGRKPLGVTDAKSDKEVHYTTAMPELFPIRSFGSFGNLSGCSMSGAMEMRMALAERNLDTDSAQSASAFRFRRTPRPNNDEEHLTRKKGNGSTLMKIRSSIGLSSRVSLTSLPPSPSKRNIGSKLKEISALFFSKFSGGDVNRS